MAHPSSSHERAAAEAEDEPQPDPSSWDFWRSWFDRSTRGQAWSAAGRWALEVLERDVGETWLDKVMKKYRGLNLDEALPYFIYLGPAHTIAYADLVEMSLRLELLRHQDGMGNIRKILKGVPRPDQFGHTMAQLQIGSLASMCGYNARLEARGANRTGPTDVLLESEMGSLRVEVAVLLPDKQFRDTTMRTNRLFEAINGIELSHHVSFEGLLPGQLGDAAAEESLAELEAVAGIVQRQGRSLSVNLGGHTVTVSPDRGGPGQGIGVDVPLNNPERRLARLLERKAEQTVGNDGVWLRVDARHGLWQFTWFELDLRQKLAMMESLVAPLRKILHLAGVVVTTGALQAQAHFEDESIEVGGSAAIRRVIEPLRVRESLIIPLGEKGASSSREWQRLYEQEPSWLPWALDRLGLPGLEEIFTPSTS